MYANPGFSNMIQFIDVQDYNGIGEYTPHPHFYQNLAEAEYVVATYMFMRLIGYAANSITILTTYNGQKSLIKDILNVKCNNEIFGLPKKVTTVDKYQGQQNDYVLLSLVRTKNVGHIRDIRRFIVSLSRARLGLYIFGRYSLYSEVDDFKSTFQHLKNGNLEIIANEKYGNKRKSSEIVKGGIITIKDFEHMYSIVQELYKINQLSQKINQ